jgi:hypothetical protein
MIAAMIPDMSINLILNVAEASGQYHDYILVTNSSMRTVNFPASLTAGIIAHGTSPLRYTSM